MFGNPESYGEGDSFEEEPINNEQYDDIEICDIHYPFLLETLGRLREGQETIPMEEWNRIFKDKSGEILEILKNDYRFMLRVNDEEISINILASVDEGKRSFGEALKDLFTELRKKPVPVEVIED